jgi:serine/threonine protein kinase
LNDPSLTEDSIDLIKRLLVINPDKRLGAGPEGSHNDMRALKGHKFFASINFDRLFIEDPPLDKKKYARSSFKKQERLQAYI